MSSQDNEAGPSTQVQTIPHGLQAVILANPKKYHVPPELWEAEQARIEAEQADQPGPVEALRAAIEKERDRATVSDGIRFGWQEKVNNLWKTWWSAFGFSNAPDCPTGVNDAVAFGNALAALTRALDAYERGGGTAASDPLPPATGEEYLSAARLASLVGYPPRKVEVFLRRLREKLTDCYRKTDKDSRRKGEPLFLYRVAAVLPELEKRAKVWELKSVK